MMGLNDTPGGERLHIGFFGRRNAGKSSIVNAVTGQELSVVSDIKGTTTDPVYKSMELLPMGPVVIIDTPGFDDEGALGELRVKKTREILNRADCAVLVVDSLQGKTKADEELLSLFKEKEIPFLIAYNKWDLLEKNESHGGQCTAEELTEENGITVSAETSYHIQELKEKSAGLVKEKEHGCRLVGDFLKPLDLVVLVVPIDKAAPKGRLILPQQQVLRDILDADGEAICVKEDRLTDTLSKLKERPAVVITDSQVFDTVAAQVPMDIPLTSFSILMARKKGLLEEAVRGAAAIARLKDGDKVLISEGCTHHRQCDDIGTVKLPNWIRQHTGASPAFSFTSGTEFPEDLSGFHLIIHCGGCMLNEREMKYRLRMAVDQNIPMTNYGVAIAYMTGILERSVRPFITLIS